MVEPLPAHLMQLPSQQPALRLQLHRIQAGLEHQQPNPQRQDEVLQRLPMHPGSGPAGIWYQLSQPPGGLERVTCLSLAAVHLHISLLLLGLSVPDVSTAQCGMLQMLLKHLQ